MRTLTARTLRHWCTLAWSSSERGRAYTLPDSQPDSIIYIIWCPTDTCQRSPVCTHAYTQVSDVLVCAPECEHTRQQQPYTSLCKLAESVYIQVYRKWTSRTATLQLMMSAMSSASLVSLTFHASRSFWSTPASFAAWKHNIHWCTIQHGYSQVRHLSKLLSRHFGHLESDVDTFDEGGNRMVL